jgi:hypothetical protein
MVLIAPFVRSRTLDVDFRFLAVPQGIEPATLDWFKSLAQSTMGYPEKLRSRERWIFARKGAYA